MSEDKISRLQRLLEDIVQLGGRSEYTKIIPNRPVTNATPAGLASYVLVRDEGGYIIPAVKVPGITYAVGDLVNLLLVKGTEPIAFQQGSGTPSVHAAGHIIQDEGVDLTQRPRLNFTGVGVTATDDAINGQTDVDIPGGGWPLTVVTIDLVDPDADYADINLAFAAGGVNTAYVIGPGTHVPSTDGLPGDGWLTSWGKSDLWKVRGTQVIGGIQCGLPFDSSGYLFFIEVICSEVAGNDATGVYIAPGVGGVSYIEHCRISVTASNVGGGDAYGVYAGGTTYIYGGDIYAASLAGTDYCIYTPGAAVVYLNGLPTLRRGGSNNFFGGAGTFQGTFQDNAGNIWKINGAAGTERLINSYLQASDGTPDPALSASTAGVITAVNWLQSDAHCFKVKNTSGGAVGYTNVGYIDAAGEFKTTTTAYLEAAWAVVITGGANGTDIYVARRGRVDIILNGNCSAGDYLYTSTTSLQAQPQAYMRPEAFAVALTANAGGAGGTCSALLLTGTRYINVQSATDIFSVNPTASSDFRATINGAPAGAAVVYNAPTSGAENTIAPTANNLFGKIRLYNETRANYALIDSVNVGTNTITLTDNAPGDWANTDVITTRSQTCVAAAPPPYFYDIDLSSADNTVIPVLARALEIEISAYDAVAGSSYSQVHPWDTFSGTKTQTAIVYLAANYASRGMAVALYQRRYCHLVVASGAATGQTYHRLKGFWVAEP